MLQQDEAEDYVIATGQQLSVRDFVNAVAEQLEMKLAWRGRGIDEKAYDKGQRCVVAVDPLYFRPAEVDTLVGDASKARAKLGWAPQISFRELVAEMAVADLRLAERDCLVSNSGYRVHSHGE